MLKEKQVQTNILKRILCPRPHVHRHLDCKVRSWVPLLGCTSEDGFTLMVSVSMCPGFRITFFTTDICTLAWLNCPTKVTVMNHSFSFINYTFRLVVSFGFLGRDFNLRSHIFRNHTLWSGVRNILWIINTINYTVSPILSNSEFILKIRGWVLPIHI